VLFLGFGGVAAILRVREATAAANRRPSARVQAPTNTSAKRSDIPPPPSIRVPGDTAAHGTEGRNGTAHDEWWLGASADREDRRS
jgi:hypothetical protein